MFCECKIAACIGPHHRFRDVGKSSRKHGDSVRLSKLVKKTFNSHDAFTWHARFVIRLKGPRLSFHHPVNGLRRQPLNYVHN